MFKKIDQSQFLIKLLQRLSNFLARKRGLPIIVGIFLLVLAFILELINMSVQLQWLELTRVILHYVGLLSALIGLLLAEPLGK